MKNKPDRNHVIVLGMHRSGTSYLIRALNLSGLYLGPFSDFYDTEIAPIEGNPKGHWENLNVIKLNEEILKINGGSWENPPENLKKIPPNFDKKIKNYNKKYYKTYTS